MKIEDYIAAKDADLRDWFAGLAMQAIWGTESSISVIANEAYRMADAMLAARVVEWLEDSKP